MDPEYLGFCLLQHFTFLLYCRSIYPVLSIHYYPFAFLFSFKHPFYACKCLLKALLSWKTIAAEFFASVTEITREWFFNYNMPVFKKRCNHYWFMSRRGSADMKHIDIINQLIKVFKSREIPWSGELFQPLSSRGISSGYFNFN